MEAATKVGVMVVNAPTSNIVTAAEHAIALLLATARNVPQGHAALKQGGGKRSRYTGVELQGKTVGVLGLGRIGVLVAQRLAAFDMNVVAFDPYVQAARAAQLGVKLVTLEELLRERLHHRPPAEDARDPRPHRRPRAAGQAVRPDRQRRPRRIVDEAALDLAIKDGRVAVRIDVFSTEPCTEPAVPPDNVVVTRTSAPAPTRRRRRCTRSPAPSSWPSPASSSRTPSTCRAAPSPRTSSPACRSPRSSAASSPPSRGVPVRLDVVVRGEIAEHDVKVLELAALKGVFVDVIEEAVTFVNAPLLARDRGVEVTLTTSEDSPDWRNVVQVRGTMADGDVVSVSGTLTGPKHAERIIEINGYNMELVPTEHMAFFSYVDRPGIVGAVGNLLGDEQVNIVGMQVGRDVKGGRALIALTVDSAISRSSSTPSPRRSAPTWAAASTSTADNLSATGGCASARPP